MWNAGSPALARSTRRHRQPFLWVLSLLLLIYATLGKAGAYLGVPIGGGNEIFVGELVLCYGLGVLLVEGGYERFFTLPVAWVWVLFMLWNAARTVPYFSIYGVTSLRDAVIWGYSLFALVVVVQLLAHPSEFALLLDRYRKMARFYVYFAVLVAPFQLFDLTNLPVQVSSMLHVTGSLAFVVCRFVAVSALWWCAFAVDFFISASQGRGAFLSFIAAVTVVLLFNPWRWRFNTRVIGTVAGMGLILAALLMMNINLGVSQAGRKIGPAALGQVLESAFTETHVEALDGSRDWRLQIWNKIVDYTLFGPYFWTGKGYGINLIIDVGMTTGEGKIPARNPENSHLTLLARSGVPGFVLWIALQITWVVDILSVLLLARRTGRRRTAALMTFILSYWMAIMVLAAAGPIFETPFGGIWFWTIFGFGAAAARMVRQDTNFFERMELGAAVVGPRQPAVSARPVPAPQSVRSA